MRINDLLIEQRIDEKPMGALSGIGNKIAAKFGSGQATGRLETGNIANQLRKEFDVYIGKTGQEMDADSISQFLQSKGLPTDAVNSQASTSGQPAAQPKAATANPQPTGRIDPTLDDPEAATDAPADEPAADNTAGNKAFGQMATQLSKPTDGAKSAAATTTTTPAPTAGKLTPQQLAAKKAELLGRRKTGASAGTTQSGFGNYVKKASGERIVGANKDGSVRTVNIKAGMYDSVSYESLREELFLTEALSKSQVDNIFKATAQLMAKQGISMPSGSAPAGAQQSGGQSAAQGGNTQQGGGQGGNTQQGGGGGGVSGLAKSFAQGFKNTGKPSDFNKTQDADQEFSGSLNFNQLANLLTNTDPATLIRALKMVISGGKLNQQQLGVLGVAMTDIIKADPATTTKIMQALKRISAE
jgi:hypothetical protein